MGVIYVNMAFYSFVTAREYLELKLLTCCQLVLQTVRVETNLSSHQRENIEKPSDVSWKHIMNVSS